MIHAEAKRILTGDFDGVARGGCRSSGFQGVRTRIKAQQRLSDELDVRDCHLSLGFRVAVDETRSNGLTCRAEPVAHRAPGSAVSSAPTLEAQVVATVPCAASRSPRGGRER
jgi:hypothetical protein